MANSKITGLPVAGALAGTEPLPVVQAAATKQSTISAILTYITANIGLAASAITSGALALARGGTGASLADPNADRILFWDDSAGAVTWLEAGSGLSITDTTITATSPVAVNIFRAERTTNQTISNSTNTKVQVGTEIFDTGADYDPTTNYRWTPPAGAVQINGNVTWDHVNSFGSFVSIFKNGVLIGQTGNIMRFVSGGGQTVSQNVSVSDSANGTDYYELYCAQYSGGNIDLVGASFSGVSFG